MEITINIPALDTLGKAIEAHANALKLLSAQPITPLAPQHPDEDPKPAQQIQQVPQTQQTQQTPIDGQWRSGTAVAPQQQLHPTQQTAPVQQAPTYQAVPTAAPQQPITQPQAALVQSVPTTVPTAAKTYTLPELAKAAGQLMDSGKQQQLIDLLNKTFGVQALNFLPVERYGDFATALRGLGAQL